MTQAWEIRKLIIFFNSFFKFEFAFLSSLIEVLKMEKS